MTTVTGDGAHVLVFPYPAQGHMIPLLDLTHQLATRGRLTITILVTPKNLPLLNPLLSKHPSIQTLVLPFPSSPSIPAGVENAKDLPTGAFREMIPALFGLYEPLFEWFQTHKSPPVAIISDMFLGWTNDLARRIGIPRLVFSPSGALAMSIVYSLWLDLPKRDDPNDDNAVISFPGIPNCPKYPWWQISPLYRSYVEGEPVSEFIKSGIIANMVSWGFVVNSFTELERVYLNHLKENSGHEHVWAVGPLHSLADEDAAKSQPLEERGGSSSISQEELLSWLDTCEDRTVVYVCFGSQAVLTNKQMEELAKGLEMSGSKFIWCMKEPTKGHAEGHYSKIPDWFERCVSGRGLVVRGWAPQVLILSHRAVGAFLTHCGWNSMLEGIFAGLPMLAWPMGADQFSDATLLVDELGVGVRVCEGATSIPDSNELARLFKEVMTQDRVDKAVRLRDKAVEAVKVGGSSYQDLDDLVYRLSELSNTTKVSDLK